MRRKKNTVFLWVWASRRVGEIRGKERLDAIDLAVQEWRNVLVICGEGVRSKTCT